jgi:hypothetical protein
MKSFSLFFPPPLLDGMEVSQAGKYKYQVKKLDFSGQKFKVLLVAQ